MVLDQSSGCSNTNCFPADQHYKVFQYATLLGLTLSYCMVIPYCILVIVQARFKPSFKSHEKISNEKDLANGPLSQLSAAPVFHPRLLHDGACPQFITSSLSITSSSPSPPILSSLFPSPAALGSGTGQLPAVWSLPFVVGTSIPQRTLRSCSTTRHPWWMATH